MSSKPKICDTCGLEIAEGTDPITFAGHHIHAARTILTQAMLGGSA